MAVQDDVAPTEHRTLPAPVFVGFPVGGSMLCLLGDNWYSRVFTNESTLYIRGTAVVFLMFSLGMRRDDMSTSVQWTPLAYGPVLSLDRPFGWGWSSHPLGAAS